MRHLLLPLVLSLAACAAPPPASRDAVLAIGDSIMAWNGAQGIPEAVAARSGLRVLDAARSGAHLSQPNGALAALGFDIGRQWETHRGAWGWVIVTAGGNDLHDHCGTPAAMPLADAIIGDDLAGELPDLIARIRASGARVAYVGYYDGFAGDATGFTGCQPQFDVLNARMARLAARDPGVVFFDAGDVIDRTDRGLYGRDRVHPTPRASALIGAALADTIGRAPPP